MKKYIHIFDEWDVVERAMRPWFERPAGQYTTRSDYPAPPLPVGTFYARKRRAEGDQWVVCRIWLDDSHGIFVDTEEILAFVWWEKILSVHESKQEARQELVRLVLRK